MNEKIADLLIKRGVNISLANDLKQTALHNAAYNSKKKVRITSNEISDKKLFNFFKVMKKLLPS